MIGLIRASATHDEAARLAREFFSREVMCRVAESLDMPQPRLRAALVGSQFMGLSMARFVIKLEPIASTDPVLLIAFYTPTIQRYLTGPLPSHDRSLPPLRLRK